MEIPSLIFCRRTTGWHTGLRHTRFGRNLRKAAQGILSALRTGRGNITNWKYQLDKACSDRNPRYYLITYTPPKTAQKPVYNAGSKYKLTAAVNVWTKPTTTSQIKKVKDLTADGRKNATSKKLNANAVLKAGTVVDADAVSTDTAGNIWLKIPSGYIAVYYKDKKRANWYNK